MKNVILATLGMGLLVMGSINTASATPVGMGGELDDSCSSLVSPDLTAGSLPFNSGTNSFDYNTVLADPSIVVGSTLTYQNMECNYAAEFSLESTTGGVTADNAATATHDNVLHYHATADFCGLSTPLLDTSADGASTQSETCAGGAITDFVVNVDTLAPVKPLVSGAYSDTLVVTLGVGL